MLVLGRRTGERVRIVTKGGEEIWVAVLTIGCGKVRIGIDADASVIICREELLDSEERAKS